MYLNMCLIMSYYVLFYWICSDDDADYDWTSNIYVT